MYEQKTSVKNETGLHARPATEFVTLAKTFQSAITLHREGSTRKPANAKSILHVLAEGCSAGSEVTVSAQGDDEREAVEKLIALIDAGFGE